MEYYLREAALADMDLYYEWVNDAAVRRASFSSAPIDYAEHQAWFRQAVASDKNRMFVLIGGGKPLGQVRLTEVNGAQFISYSIDRRARGRGLGKTILKLAARKLARGTVLVGEVRTENAASIAVFSALGYRREDKGERVIFRLIV